MADTKKTLPRTYTRETWYTRHSFKKKESLPALTSDATTKTHLLETKITLRIPYKAGREPVQQLYVRILNAVTFLV